MDPTRLGPGSDLPDELYIWAKCMFTLYVWLRSVRSALKPFFLNLKNKKCLRFLHEKYKLILGKQIWDKYTYYFIIWHVLSQKNERIKGFVYSS